MSQHPPTERPVARPATFESAPDWTVFQDEIECPLCGYNLRGLTEARCPECGSKYEWRDLLDPRRRMHESLFEYHTGSMTKAFFRTQSAARNSLTFWESVHPVLPIRMERLLKYCGLVFFSLFLSFAFGQFVISTQVAVTPWWRRGFSGNVWLPWTWSPMDFGQILESNPFFFDAVVWFVATLAAMFIFQSTMRRTKIRNTHIFRCLVYSCDRFFSLAIILLVLDGFESLGLGEMCVPVQFFALIIVLFRIMFRLVMAFHIYLQFPNPFLTVLATQAIAVLAVLNIHAVTVWL